jgi:prolyl oligopeptidase
MREVAVTNAKRRALQLASLLVGLAVVDPSAMAAVAPAPSSPPGQDFDVLHGVQVQDPFRWLERSDDPKVRAWNAAQTIRTRAYLDALPVRERLGRDLEHMMRSSGDEYFEAAARGSSVFFEYYDSRKSQPELVALNENADPSTRRSVVDPNRLDPTGATTIDWWVPSPDGSKMAVSLSRSGSEDGVLHIFDVASGAESEAPIRQVQYPTAGGSLAWAADGKSFWYTRYPDAAEKAERGYHVQVYLHRLGADAVSDRLVLGAADGLERNSEVFLTNRFALGSAMAMVQRGDGDTWAFYVLGDAKPIEVAGYGDAIVYATLGPDGAIYAISRKDAPNGKILKLTAPFDTGTLAHAPVIVPQGPLPILSGGVREYRVDLNFDNSHLFVRDMAGGPMRLRAFDLDGKPKGELPTGGLATNFDIEPLANGGVLYDLMTYQRSPYYVRWSPDRPGVQETRLRWTRSYGFDDAVIKRVFARSKDGTRIPVDLVMRKGTKLDGRNPLLLTGYGAFGISQTPKPQGPMGRAWLDAGGIYAVAVIRGGSEFGETWRRQGTLTHKQNGIDDFYAAARLLIDKRYTSSAKLALMGGSAGGLLMGAEITQHPRLARAVVSYVGVYDMIHAENDPNGAYTVNEYGSVKDPEQFRALYAYSPYHHVTAGAHYPAVLLQVGENDGRVNPMNSRKFAAALQTATASSYPILFTADETSGHGLGASIDQQVAEQTDRLAFLFDQLSMTYRPH